MAKQPKARKQPKAQRPRRKDPIDAAMTLIAERGWTGFDLPDVAAAANIPLAEFSRDYWTKTDLLTAFQRRTDARVLEHAGSPDEEETPRDRLFDILMQRFDALQPYREALSVLTRDLPRDPQAALIGARNMRQSMAWMAAAAGVSNSGWKGILIVKGLMAVWVYTMRTWLTDDSPDMSKTMAALDKALSRAETGANSLFKGRAPGSGDA